MFTDDNIEKKSKLWEYIQNKLENAITPLSIYGQMSRQME